LKAGHLWLLALAVLPILGAPLLAHPGFRRWGLAGRAVVAGGVGAVLLSWAMTAWALAGLQWGPSVVAGAAIAAFALRLALRGGWPDSGRPPVAVETGEARAGTWTTRAAIALTSISVLAVLAATAAARSTSPDLLLFWGPKAQSFAAARTIDAGFLRAPYLEYLQPYYPPLVTNVFAFGAMAVGRLPLGAVTLTFPFLLAATAVGLAGVLQPASPSRAWPTAALAASALGAIGIRASVAGNAEPFLWFFELVGVGILLSPAAGSTGGKLVAGLLLAGAAASKVEGLPFVVAAAVLFLVVHREARRPIGRTLLLLLGPTVVALGTWFAFGAARNLFRGYRGYGKILGVRWSSLPGVIEAIGISIWHTGYALPWLVPLVLLLLAPAKDRRALLPAGIAVVLVGFLLFVYSTTSGSDPKVLVSWSAVRVFAPLSGLFVLSSFASREGR
jgi:hypothetical protein